MIDSGTNQPLVNMTLNNFANETASESPAQAVALYLLTVEQWE